MRSEYKYQNYSNKYIFDVTPAKKPFPLGSAIILLFGFLLIFLMTGNGALIIGGTPGVMIYVSILIYIYYSLIRLSYRVGPAVKFREPAHFEITADGIHSKGENILLEKIHRLIIRNNISRIESTHVPSMVVGGSGAIGVGMAGVASVGAGVLGGMQAVNAHQINKVANVSYRLDVEASGKSITLAGGMDETTVFGLMTDVSKAIEKLRAQPA